MTVQARSSEGLAHLRLYQDGQLIGDRSMSGPQFAGEIALPATGNARWVTALGHRQGRAGLGAANAPAQAGAGLTEPPPRRAGRRRHLCRGTAQADVRQVRCAPLANALKASIGRYYGAESLQLLLDGEATPSAIAAALEKVVATAQPHDTIVFSFAGHGVKGDDGHYYLTPGRLQLRRPQGDGPVLDADRLHSRSRQGARGRHPGLLPSGLSGRRGPGHQR